MLNTKDPPPSVRTAGDLVSEHFRSEEALTLVCMGKYSALLTILLATPVLAGCAAATAAETPPSPVPNAKQTNAIQSELEAIEPALNVDAAPAAASRFCVGDGMKSWDHDELLRGVQLHFGDPAGVTLTEDQQQGILTVVLDNFCHA